MNTKTLNISLPPSLIQQLDRVAKERSANRSELIREALRNYLTRRGECDKLFAIGKRQAKKLGVTTEEDVVRIVREYRKQKNA